MAHLEARRLDVEARSFRSSAEESPHGLTVGSDCKPQDSLTVSVLRAPQGSNSNSTRHHHPPLPPPPPATPRHATLRHTTPPAPSAPPGAGAGAAAARRGVSVVAAIVREEGQVQRIVDERLRSRISHAVRNRVSQFWRAMFKYAVIGTALALGAKALSDLAANERSFAPTDAYKKRSDRPRPADALGRVAGPGGAETEFFMNKDKLYIYYRKWVPIANAHPAPKAMVVLLHGLGEHVNRYVPVARALNRLGIVVYGLDHQGHGHSEGDRVFVKSFDDYVADALQLVAIAKQENPSLSKHTYLFGHSMGGLMALQTLLKAQAEFEGAIISAPALMVDPAVVSPTLVTTAKALGRSLPRLPLDALDVEELSRNPWNNDWYSNDPLVYHGMVPARL